MSDLYDQMFGSDKESAYKKNKTLKVKKATVYVVKGDNKGKNEIKTYMD